MASRPKKVEISRAQHQDLPASKIITYGAVYYLLHFNPHGFDNFEPDGCFLDTLYLWSRTTGSGSADKTSVPVLRKESWKTKGSWVLQGSIRYLCTYDLYGTAPYVMFLMRADPLRGQVDFPASKKLRTGMCTIFCTSTSSTLSLMVVSSAHSDDTLSSGSDSGIETGEGFWNEGRKPARIYRGIPDGIPVSYSSDKVSRENIVP